MSNTRGIKVTGLTELLESLDNMAADSLEICESAAHAGIDIMADDMKARINALKTTADSEYGSSSQKRYCYSWEKQGLIDSMGITPVRYEGSKVDFKVGFDGYAEGSKVSKKYPKGKANAMIAYSVNAGTSFMQSQPFLKKTVSGSRGAAIEAIKAEIETQLKKYMA